MVKKKESKMDGSSIMKVGNHEMKTMQESSSIEMVPINIIYFQRSEKEVWMLRYSRNLE